MGSDPCDPGPVGLQVARVAGEEVAPLPRFGIGHTGEGCLERFDHLVGVGHPGGILPELADIAVRQQTAEEQHRDQCSQTQVEALDGQIHGVPFGQGRSDAIQGGSL